MGSVFLEGSSSGAEHVLDADLCELAARPQEYSGRLVQVQGLVSFGFEESAVSAPTCGARLWLEVPDEAGQVHDRPPAGTRAILGVSYEQFQEWSKSGTLIDPDALPWRTVEAAKPVRAVRNKRWRQLEKIPWNCPSGATLIGRVDHLPGPGFIVPGSRGGFVWGISGYGHEDQYPIRLVIAEVVTLDAGSRCKK
jgi:hypothetical protein